MRRGSQNRAAVERSSRKLLLFWEERVCEDMENLQNEYGNTIEQGLCVVKYFVMQSAGWFLYRAAPPAALSARFKRQKRRPTATVQSESTTQLSRARLGR